MVDHATGRAMARYRARSTEEVGIWGRARGNLGAKPGGLVFSRRLDSSMKMPSSPATLAISHMTSASGAAHFLSVCLSAVTRPDSARPQSRNKTLKIVSSRRKLRTVKALASSEGLSRAAFVLSIRVCLVLQRRLKILSQNSLVSPQERPNNASNQLMLATTSAVNSCLTVHGSLSALTSGV